MWAKMILTVAVFSFCGATAALADGGHHGRGKGHAYGRGYGHAHGAVVSARVVGVEPMVRYVTVERPRQSCWDEVVQQPVRPFGVAGPTIAGGIIGGAIGRQFGSGDTRDVLTVAGAVAGSAIAHERAVRNGAGATRDVVVQRCEVVNERVTEQIVDGYLVTYRYDGRNYTMRTDRHPGDYVQLAVDVRPIGYGVRS
jgi:uncharacterized protein YcfJ